MVKFGKKFFFNKTYIKKNRTVAIISVITVILLIVTTYFITSQFYSENIKSPQKIVETYEEINVKLFDKLPYMISYFRKLENTKISDIKVTYPDNFTYSEDTTNCSEEQIKTINAIKNGEKTDNDVNEAFSCVTYRTNLSGSFNVKITVEKNEYTTKLNVIDDEAPKLVAKDFEIYEDEYYSVDDFVESCTDNSKKECNISFLNTSLVNYSNYKEPGTYDIKLAATDNSGNKSEAAIVTLTIKKIMYYEVKFDTAGGTSIENQTIREGRTITYPSYPSRSGYTFEGWYYNNKEFDLNTPVTSDMTITAKWKKIPTTSGGTTGGSTSSNGGTSSGGSSSGGGGSTSSKCIKYSEAYANVSIYFYQLNGGSANDCMPTSTKNFEADILEIANNNQENVRNYHKNIYGTNCSTKVNQDFLQPVVASGRYAGYLIKYTVLSNCTEPKTYTLHCSSKNNCDIW